MLTFKTIEECAVKILLEYKYLLLVIALAVLLVTTEALVWGTKVLPSLTPANAALGVLLGAWAASKE